MHVTSSTVMYIFESATNPRSPLTLSHPAGFTPTMASTSGMEALFITQVLHTGCGADRWNRFLSSVSRTAEKSAFNPGSDASTVAKWWSEHARVWASRVIDS
jgi:hypothetical protein